MSVAEAQAQLEDDLEYAEKNGYENIILEHDYIDYEISVDMVGTRIENDKEYNKRLKAKESKALREERYREEQEQKERNELERLTNKYKGTTNDTDD